MTALNTALLESETKESLAAMVCELRQSSATPAAEMRERAAALCDELADNAYVASDYGRGNGLRAAAEKIRALPLPTPPTAKGERTVLATTPEQHVEDTAQQPAAPSVSYPHRVFPAPTLSEEEKR